MKNFLLAIALSVASAHAQQPVSVHDPALNNMVAWNGTIPSGWSFEGHIQRDGPGAAGQIILHLASPDGLITYQSYPALISTDLPALKMNGILTHRLSSVELLTRYVLPRLVPGGVNVNDPTRNPVQAMPDGTTFDSNLISIHETRNGRTFSTALVGGTIAMPKQGGHYFAITQIASFSAPTGREREASGLILPLRREVSQQWIQADHQHILTYFQAKSKDIATSGTNAILAGAAQQRESQDALFNASMASTAAMEHARHEGAMQSMDVVGDRTRTYFWHNTVTGLDATTSTSYPPAGSNWINVTR